MRISVTLQVLEQIAAGELKCVRLPITTPWSLRLGQHFGAVYEDGILKQGEDLPEFMRKDPVQPVDFYGGCFMTARKIRAVCRLDVRDGKFCVEILRIENNEKPKGERYEI